MPTRVHPRRHGARGWLLAGFALLPCSGVAQADPGGTDRARRPVDSAVELDSLLARAVATKPEIRAVAGRLRAAEARIAPAGAGSDPMLMVGAVNLPIADSGFDGFMTMKMVGLQRRSAAYERDAAAAELVETALEVRSRVAVSYYALALAARLRALVGRHHELLGGLLEVADANYRVGRADQADVLRLRVGLGRLAQEATRLEAERRMRPPALNALLSRPTDAPMRGSPSRPGSCTPRSATRPTAPASARPGSGPRSPSPRMMAH